MSNFNKVILLGRLTRDPEIRFTSKGLAVTNITLAVSRKSKGEDSLYKDEATFIDVSVFGKNAEVVSKFFSKGSSILVEGRLKMDQWSTNGVKRTKLIVILESFQFTGYSNSSGGVNPNLNNSGDGDTILRKGETGTKDTTNLISKELGKKYENNKANETDPF